MRGTTPFRRVFLRRIEHAETDTAQVTVGRTDEGLYVDVVDEGVGFDPADTFADQSPTLGLPGVRESVERLGGTLTVEAAPGEGTRVTATLPVHIASLPEQELGDESEL